jgi:hypothetical protein
VFQESSRISVSGIDELNDFHRTDEFPLDLEHLDPLPEAVLAQRLNLIIYFLEFQIIHRKRVG